MEDGLDLAELERYIQYLQRQLLTPGTEAWFQHERFKEAILARPPSADALPLGNQEMVDEYLRYIAEFQPTGPFDSASANAIFQPLMDAVVTAGRAAGFRTGRAITLATSTAIEATPYTRSTEGVHIIFLGAGTYAYCNYWAKVFASLTMGKPVRKTSGSVPLTFEAIRDAARLALYYASMDTVLGFGVLESKRQWAPFRLEYLRAMELFVVGHEYGHCVAEDASERYRGTLLPAVQNELELLCDRIGTSITRFASSNDSWAGFCGAGAVLIMYAHEMCEAARRHLGRPIAEAHHYPNTARRVEVIRHQVVSTTPEDQLAAATAYIDDVITLCKELVQEVDKAIGEAVKRGTSAGE